LDRKTKERVVADLHEKLKSVKFAVLVDYTGVNVEKITALRNKLREAEAEFRVVKNTLLEIASKGTNFVILEEQFKGPLAIFMNYGDEVRSMKALVDFAKENQEVEIKAGMLDGRFLSREELNVLAYLPGRDILIGKILSLLMAAQISLVNVLDGVPRSFVQVIEAHRVRG
jgi:Ribosomal protein L10